MLLEYKNVVIYGGGRFIGGEVAWTFANVTSGTFTVILLSLPRQLSVEERQRDD
jgi:hypothetical protein